MQRVGISDLPDRIDISGRQFCGVFVAEIGLASKAAKAGFKNGDTIVAAGTTEVRTLDDLGAALTAQTGKVTFKLFSSYEHREIALKP